VGLLAATGTAFAESSAPAHAAVLNEAVAGVLGPPRVAAIAAQPKPPLVAFRQATQAGLSPINSALTFGAPADLAAGWDGTLWAIDQLGAPHVYDSLSTSWQLHGTGIDGAALIDDAGPAVYFRGGELFIAKGPQAPKAIASVWPSLPQSYPRGQGRHQSANWQDGVIDGVYSQGGPVLLIHGAEFVTLSFSTTAAPVASGPTPLNQHASFANLPDDWQANGFDAGFFTVGGPAANSVFAFKGRRHACIKHRWVRSTRQ
jgi:hypothetical protein